MKPYCPKLGPVPGAPFWPLEYLLVLLQELTWHPAVEGQSGYVSFTLAHAEALLLRIKGLDISVVLCRLTCYHSPNSPRNDYYYSGIQMRKWCVARIDVFDGSLQEDFYIRTWILEVQQVDSCLQTSLLEGTSCHMRSASLTEGTLTF